MNLFTKLCGIILWALAVKWSLPPDLACGYLGDGILGLVVSVLGSCFILMRSHWLKGLSWIGKHTLEILCAHILVTYLLNIFDFSAEFLCFAPSINFLLEASYSVALALIISWMLAKTNILRIGQRI